MDASKQLQSDIQACKPINLGEYQTLLNEAAKNKQRADKMAKKGIPVDQKQVDADLAAASALFNQATAALVQQCLRQAQAAQPKETSLKLSQFAEQVLVAHNVERAAVGAPSVRWDPALESSATAYAGVMARTGQLVHAPREGRGIERENLSEGMLGWGPLQMMRNWINEKRRFKVGVYPDVSTTGDWMDVSHYTQMIWPTTTDIGCGMASGSGFNWLVCRYSPGGNKDGKLVGTQTGFQTVGETKGVPPIPADTPANPQSDPGYTKPTIDLVQEVNGSGEDDNKSDDKITGGSGSDTELPSGAANPVAPSSEVTTKVEQPDLSGRPPIYGTATNPKGPVGHPDPSAVEPSPFIVFFDWDKDEITPQAAAILDNASAAYRQSGRAKIVLASHSRDETSESLDGRRRRNVEAYLTALGIPEAAIDSGAVEIISR